MTARVIAAGVLLAASLLTLPAVGQLETRVHAESTLPAPPPMPPEAATERAGSAPATSEPARAPVLSEAEAASLARAETHRSRALRFYDARNLRAARREFLRAYEALPSYRLLYNLGIVSMALGDSAAAFGYFERYLDQGGDQVPAARRAAVERQLQDLAEHVATLEVTTNVAGARVLIDGEPAGTTPLTVPLRLNAGFHVIAVQASSGQLAERRVLLIAGHNPALHLGFLSSRPGPVRATRAHAPPIAPEPDSSPAHWMMASWTTTGVLAASTLFAGIQALSAHGRHEEELQTFGTTRERLNEADGSASRWSLAADLLGGATLVAGVVSTWITLRQRAPSKLGSGGAAASMARRGVLTEWSF